MKKTIILSALCLSMIVLITAFKSIDSEKKEYVTIYSNQFNGYLTLSSSDGTFKTIKVEKTKGICDQTQLLKLINELEVQGYKLLEYNLGTLAPSNISLLVVMVK